MALIARLRAAFVATAALTAAASATAEQISVTHWGVLMYGVPYAVAMDKGLFKQSGIDIDGILTSKGGGTTVRNVLAGGLPYGEVSLAAAVAAAKQGVDIRIVNSGAATVGEILWVTLPDSPVKSIQDLAGRKMAFTSPKSVTEMVAIMALEKAGVKLDRVDRIATGGIGAGLTALSQGGVAAAPIMDPVWARDGQKYRPLFFAKDVLPVMTQTVGITTPDFIKAHPDKLKSIIAGRRAGVDYALRNPAEAGAIFAREYNLTKEIGEQSVRNMIAIGFWSPGAIDRKALDAMIDGLRIIGEVDGPVDWSKLVDARFLPADLQSGS
jgi:NitT/TauT family transport system substrate-binding protein